MNSTDDLQRRHSEWRDRTFPGHDTPQNILAHLRREFRELTEEADPARIPAEAADCFLLLCRFATLCGFSLHAAGEEKFAVCQTREWGEPDEEGVVEYVR